MAPRRVQSAAGIHHRLVEARKVSGCRAGSFSTAAYTSSCSFGDGCVAARRGATSTARGVPPRVPSSSAPRARRTSRNGPAGSAAESARSPTPGLRRSHFRNSPSRWRAGSGGRTSATPGEVRWCTRSRGAAARRRGALQLRVGNREKGARRGLETKERARAAHSSRPSARGQRGSRYQNKRQPQLAREWPGPLVDQHLGAFERAHQLVERLAAPRMSSG